MWKSITCTLAIIYISYILLKILKTQYGSDKLCYKNFLDLQTLHGILPEYIVHKCNFSKVLNIKVHFKIFPRIVVVNDTCSCIYELVGSVVGCHE